MSSQSWRIRDLQEMCARRVVACISQDAEGSSLLAQQLCFAPASVLEGLWAYAAESDRLSDALARAALAPGSEVCSLELGSVPLGVTERGVTEGVRALPALCGRVVVGWPSHFGATLARWLTRALHERERGGAAVTAIEVRAAGLGGGQGGVVPATWSRLFGGPSARDDDDVDGGGGGFGDDVAPRSAPSARSDAGRSRTAHRRQMSALLGRARAAAHGEAASLAGVGDGELKSVLRAVDGVGLVAFKVSGAREAEGRFADALATCAPALRELRFRDAPAVSDGAAAALAAAVGSTVESVDFCGTGAGPRFADAAHSCARLTRLNVDGCANFGDEALDGVLGGCPGLRDLSCRRCAALEAGPTWYALATSGLALASVRVDLRRPAPRAAPAARRDAALALLAADDDFGDDGDDATTDDVYDAADVELALSESLADLAPFDAPFRGSHLRSLRVALVGHARREVRDGWLAALVAKVPASVVEFEARGGWGADLPAASAPALGDVAELGALPRLQHVSVACGDPRVLDLNLKLRTLNLASPSLAAAHVALALRTLEATLKTASLARTAPPGGENDDDDCVLRAPRLESLHVSHVVFGEVLLERCHQLVALSLDRCVVKRLACAAPDRRPHCPVLAELTCARCRGGFGDRANAEAAPRDFHALRRLRAPTDAFAAAFAAVSSSGGAALKSLTLDETGDAPAAARAPVPGDAGLSLGAALCGRAARRAAYLGAAAPHLDGLVVLELVAARDFGAKHLSALPVACPALRRLRLAACAALRGALVDDGAFAAASARESDRKLSATSDGHFGEMTPVKAGRGDDDDDEGDPLFELDDLDEARAPRGSVRFSDAASTPLRQPAFDDAAPRRRPRSAPSRTPDAPPRGTPPNATPPSSERRRSSGKAAKASRSATKERFDPLLQCHVGCPGHEDGPVAALMRRLADTRGAEYRRYAKVASTLPSDKRGGRAACARFLAGRCGQRDCEFAHGFCAKAHKSERKLRPLLELLEDVDEFRRRRGLAAPPGSSPGAWDPDESHSDYESEGDARLSRSPTPTSALSSSPGSSPGNARSDFGGRRRDTDDDGGPELPRNTLVFENLEALELDACHGVDALVLDAPRLLALCLPRCDGLRRLDANLPRLTHLDLGGCASLEPFALLRGSLLPLSVASLAHCARLPEPFLHRFVDHCRRLTHVDIYGASAAPPGSSPGAARTGSQSTKKTKAGTLHGDPSRCRTKSKAGLEKLKAGRPHLAIVKTRKEHESSANATRTTLDLRPG